MHVRRDLVENGAPLEEILGDINSVVRTRGAIVLSSGQFLRFSLDPNWSLDTHFTEWNSGPAEHVDRPWAEHHRDYFQALWGVSEPFQYTEASASYDQYAVNVRVPAPYLVEGELILALLDAERDGMRFYCPCHFAEVVYTSKHRLLCMGCGQLHCVLAQPISLPKDGLSETEWDALFDADGEILDEDATVPVIDFQEVESVPKLWVTDAWVEASRTVEFFARAPEDERERYKRSVTSPGTLIEAGFTHVPTPPPPVLQLGEHEYEVGLGDNAASAARAGAAAYARSKGNLDELRAAILHLFQAVELILKARLLADDPSALKNQPNNPAVLSALRAGNADISDEDEQVITDLRRLRNKLQHGEAGFSYRRTRSLLRKTLVFLDRFALEELGWWLGDVVDAEDWRALLQIESIHLNAEAMAAHSVSEARQSSECVVDHCPLCARETLIRTSQDGSRCAYCGHHPTVEELYPEDFPPLR